MRRALALLLLNSLCVCAWQAQPATEWLASPQATEFRERVIQLALIYGESSGIDLQGFKVLARKTGNQDAGCADVEVVTSKGKEEVKRESLRACKAH